MSQKVQTKKTLSTEERVVLLDILKKRFEKNMHRHKGFAWEDVEGALKAQPGKLWTVNEMELSGGEPDVVVINKKAKEIVFVDCAPETPKGRRSICYDRESLESRKEHKPENSAIDMAIDMGVELLTEQQYYQLQEYGPFDTKTSSWLKTPDEVRELGGAIFGDYRYGRVFIYHNGAQSYYSGRGFRSIVYL